MPRLEGLNQVTFATRDMDRLAKSYAELFEARELMDLPVGGDSAPMRSSETAVTVAP